MPAQPQYILFRQGKTAIGPFETILAAAVHMGRGKGLLGYCILPMVSVDYSVPSTPGRTGQEILVDMGERHKWEDASTPSVMELIYDGKSVYSWYTRNKSSMAAAAEFMLWFSKTYPDIEDAENKIRCIKALRSLFGCGLKETKDVIDKFITGSGAMHT